MAGFLTRRESRKQYESIGGGNFNDAYRSQKDALRQSGLRGRDLRQTARQAVIDDQNLTNIQNTALQNSEQYAPTEDMITGMEMAGYDQNERQMQRDNYAFRQNLLNAQPIEVSSMPAQIQTKQATDAAVETPAPGQPAQIQSAQQETPAPVQEKYKGQKDYDDLNFNQAFGQAMKDIGEGGVFYYKGRPFKLAYREQKTNTPAQTHAVDRLEEAAKATKKYWSFLSHLR